MEIVIPLALFAYVGLLLIIPLVILVFFVHQVRILKQYWRPIFAKVIAAIVVWVFLSFVMMYVNFIYVYAGAHARPEERGAILPMLILLALTIGYGAAGWVLCYWVKGGTNGEE
ncbi:MAG: hypothetical protein M3362_21680 [Acidobacteriota bacterium]|nr:hypothetical protein [Acidobacteriota bacterium]